MAGTRPMPLRSRGTRSHAGVGPLAQTGPWGGPLERDKFKTLFEELNAERDGLGQVQDAFRGAQRGAGRPGAGAGQVQDAVRGAQGGIEQLCHQRFGSWVAAGRSQTDRIKGLVYHITISQRSSLTREWQGLSSQGLCVFRPLALTLNHLESYSRQNKHLKHRPNSLRGAKQTLKTQTKQPERGRGGTVTCKRKGDDIQELTPSHHSPLYAAITDATSYLLQ